MQLPHQLNFHDDEYLIQFWNEQFISFVSNTEAVKIVFYNDKFLIFNPMSDPEIQVSRG